MESVLWNFSISGVLLSTVLKVEHFWSCHMLSFKNRETDPYSNILRILVYFQSYETLKEC